ncbi:RNase P subunit p30 family protein [Haloferacaceae archaeon DSL9]
MYEAVYAHPDGDSTVSRQARTAARYGYDGLVVRSRKADYDAARIADRYGVDVANGIEVVADNRSQASGSIGNFRRQCTVLLVRGGTNELNRFAVEQERVDVLAKPMRRDGDFNHVLARAARDNGVHVEFDFGPALRATGGQRVQALQRLRKLREIVEHYETPYVVSAAADSHLKLRGPRELLALGEVVGFNREQIRAGLEAWEALVDRNRARRSESFIAPGVHSGRYEEES